jgi:hypothetical protein
VVGLVIVFVGVKVLSVDMFFGSRHVAVRHESVPLLSLSIKVFFVLLSGLSLVLLRLVL